YRCVVGFADGGSAVTVSAGLALIGKTPSGDTLRRGVIPVQRHATVADAPAVSGRRPVRRLDVRDRATAAGTSRRRAPRRDRHHGDTYPGGEVLDSGEHAAPDRAGQAPVQATRSASAFECVEVLDVDDGGAAGGGVVNQPTGRRPGQSVVQVPDPGADRGVLDLQTAKLTDQPRLARSSRRAPVTQ